MTLAPPYEKIPLLWSALFQSVSVWIPSAVWPSQTALHFKQPWVQQLKHLMTEFNVLAFWF